MKVDVIDDFFKLLHPCIPLLVVSVSKDGKPNVMTCAWNMPVSEEPPTIALAIDRESYTNKLIKESREFTVNIPGDQLLDAIWICGTKSGREVDKFRLAKISPEPAKKVKPPIIRECVGHLECRLRDYIEVGECTLFIGEVLEAYALKDALAKGVWDIKRTRLPLHLGGRSFTVPTEIIEPKRRR